MKNEGNSCFLISATQLLLAAQDFGQSCENVNESLMLLSYQKVNEAIEQGSRPLADAAIVAFRIHLGELVNEKYFDGKQEDSSEVLLGFLNRCQRDILRHDQYACKLRGNTVVDVSFGCGLSYEEGCNSWVESCV